MHLNSNKTNNVGIYMLDVLNRFDNETAIIVENKQYSGKQSVSIIQAAANQLLASGVRPGDVVAIKNDNPFEHFASSISIALVGATAISQSQTISDEATQEQDEQLNIQWLFASTNKQTRTDLNSKKTIEFQEERVSNIDEIVPQCPEAPWIIATGSGSTGKPKYMPIKHWQQIQRCESAKDWIPYTNEDNFASLVNVTFYMGKNRVMESLSVGTKVVFLPINGTTTNTTLKLIKTIYATPYHLNNLLNKSDVNTEKLLPNLRHILVAGGIVSQKLRQKARDKLCSNLHILYGSNESCSCTIASPPESYFNAAPVGRAMEKFDIDIVDEQNMPIESGSIGFIRIKSDCCISTYLNDDEASRKAFVDAYFFPGDRGRIDDNGLLYFEGRTDGMMIFNGINIFPSEIELCLLKHPDVDDVAVTGVQHEIHGDIPTAVISLKDNSKATKESLHQFTINKLARKFALQIILTDALPRNEQGKLPKSRLKAWIIDHRRSQKTMNDHLFDFFHSVNGLNFEGSRIGLSIHNTSISNHHQANAFMKHLRSYSGFKRDENRNTQQIFLLILRNLVQAVIESSSLPPCYGPTFTQLGNHNGRDLFIVHFPQFPSSDVRILKPLLQLCIMIIFDQDPSQNLDCLESLIQKKIKQAALKIYTKYKDSDLFKNFGKSSAKLTDFAVSRNIPLLFQPGGYIQFGLGSQSFKMLRSGCDTDTAHGALLSKDKLLTSQSLQTLGFPTAFSQLCLNLDHAIHLFKEYNTAVTIKPADGDRGEGVTTQIESIEELKTAYHSALKFTHTKRVIIEENISGTCHRVFIANGRFIYCVKRNPNGIFGDGYRSIQELVGDANQKNETMQKTVVTDPKLAIDSIALYCLEKNNMTPQSIPLLNEFIPLRPIETTRWGGIDTDCTKVIHSDNIALAIQASKKIGLSICGVDIMSNDISIPWHQNGAKIIELNFQPLIGGGEASLKTLDQFFKGMLNGEGKIPIHAVYGSAHAKEKALKKQIEFIQSGVERTFVALIDSILVPNNHHQKMSHNNLYKNTISCLADQDCDALIIVINSNELLKTGLPINYLSSLEICDDNIYKGISSTEHASRYEYAIIKEDLIKLTTIQDKQDSQPACM